MRFFRQKDADMTQGSITGQIMQFAAPMMIGLLFQQLYNTVDSIVVGQFVGKEALAAVGSTSSIINTLVGFSAGLSTGSSVVISQCYGAHDRENLRRSVHTTLSVTFILSVLATLLGRFLTTPLLHLMSTPDDVFREAQVYLNIYFSGISGLLVYNMGSSILRAVGDSRRPLYFLCFSAALNTVLDLLFVIRFGMGVDGVAYATIISQFISALLILFVLSHEHTDYGVRWRELSLDGAMVRRIFSIGLPAAIQQAITAFSNVFVQSYINFFGSACMAGWSSYNKLDMFLAVPAQSIGMAVTTFVGQNYGANQMTRARKGVERAAVISAGVTLALTAAIMIFADASIRFFTTEPDVMTFGVFFIRQISPFYICMSFIQVFAGALRGIGNAKTPMIIMLSSFVVFRQIYLFVGKLLGNSLSWVSLAYPMGWLLCAILLAVSCLRSRIYKAAQT